MVMKRYILTYVCCGMLAGGVMAQQQDSIAKMRDAAAAQDSAMQRRSQADTAYRVKYNALSYSMQKRYQPQGREFVNKKFLDNFFVSFWGGYNRIIPQGGMNLSGGPEIGLSVSKFFSPKNGVRLLGSWQSANRQSDNEKWTNYTFGVDHIFNLSTALGGYNPYRMLELSTVEGLGVHLASLAGEKQKAIDFHLGLQMKISTGTRLDVFMEPGISFYTDGIDISGNNNSHGYDIGFNARVGMNYRLGTFTPRGSTEAGDENFLDNTFISAGMGLQAQNSSLAREQGLLGSTGPIFSVAAGKWFLDLFGFRLSAFGSYDVWKANQKLGIDRMTMYAGGRAEVMLNPFAFFKKDVRSMKWGIVPMFGVELGMMKKQDERELVSKSYTGMTGGIQFKYYPTENLAFFVEPRMSFVPYTFTEKTISGKVNEYSFMDKLMNVSVGVELRRPTRPQWQQLAKLRGDFTPYYYTSYAVGMTMPQQLNRPTSRRPGFIIGAAVGRQLSSLSGVRLGLDFNNAATRSSDNKIDRYTFMSLSLDYMFDISNWVIGYDPERKFGTEVFGGPVVTRCFDPGKTYVGLEGGVRPYWRLGGQFDVFAEPKLRVYTKRYMNTPGGKGTPLQLSFALGTSYRFNPSYRKSLTESGFGDGTIWGNTFISGGVGFQSLVGSSRSMDALASAGPTMSISVGKWLLPFWGLRFSGFAGISSWRQATSEYGTLSDKRTMQGGIRVESMFDILSFWKYDKERRWGIVPMLGLELGKVRRQSEKIRVSAAGAAYAGITAGLQCKYYVSDAMALFIEPRFSRVPYSYRDIHVEDNYIGPRTSVADNVMSVQIGLEFRRAGGRTLKELAALRKEFEPYYFASWNVGANMPVHRVKYDSGAGLGVLIGVSGGRQFFPCSGARVGLDYTALPGRNGADARKLISVSADYLFDITHFMGGYNPERKFGVEILAGPVLAFGSEPNKTTFGLEGGLHFYYKLVKGFGVFAEPRIRMYTKNILAGGDLTPVHAAFSVGTSYRF
ncbi:hypothetical protein BacF7301_06925 [Bacteroides faecium]|uniref:Uncharacterized protein n=2 Tax=Bacteroides faecium TaxID=2715212 RepID=A0A6H0KL32_9BACE|nr:hypothetical protein BacF7301_06925 [Bacteroides faecium]